MDIKKMPKNAKNYACNNCDFICSKHSNYIKHLATAKHKKQEKGYNYDITDKHEIIKTTEEYKCECGKLYNYYSGLWRHRKKCQNITGEQGVEPKSADIVDLLLNENKEFKNVILDLVKSNQDLQKQMLEVCKTSATTTNNTTNHNSHNKTFNLQFFLNEQCKDAMNIMEFVDTFQLQLSDLEHIGEVGYVEGISNIVMDKLSQMDIYKRPIHCSDAKREIMHVKDKDVWEKDTPTNAKIRLALKHITKKNTDMLRPWVNAHPGVLDSEHRLNDKYQQLFIEAMGGNSGTITECETKIIKKISKMVLIDKYQ